MKSILIITILLVSASFLAPAQTTSEKVSRKSSLQLEIATIEEDWHRALAGRDVALLDRVLANEFISVGGNGKSQNKAETIAGLKASVAVYEYFTPYDLDVRPYGDMVVVIGRFQSQRTLSRRKPVHE